MQPSSHYHRAFLISLLLSLAWYYYSSFEFQKILGTALHCSAGAYLISYLWQCFRQSPARPSHRRTYWTVGNSILLFSLIFISEIIATNRYQYTAAQYLLHLVTLSLSLSCLIFCIWKIRDKQCATYIQTTFLLCSGLLLYEIYLTTTKPNPNSTQQLAPVMEESFISYNGGNGRLINSHYWIPQRRYLTQLVPGQQTFRPKDQADQAGRIAHDFGTTVLAPANGTVVSAIDHLPDLPAGTTDPTNPPGNHLCLQLDSGNFLYLANFQQNSIQVSPGEDVSTGQILGRIGKNGSFTESALVILLVDHPDVISPETHSLPFDFKQANGSLQFPKKNTHIRVPPNRK